MIPDLSREAREKRTVVRLRISAEDKRVLQAAATREHLTLSAWLRRLALQKAEELLGTQMNKPRPGSTAQDAP